MSTSRGGFAAGVNDGSPPWNVAGAGRIRSTSGGLQLLSGVLLKDDSPSLNVASAGSIRSTSWGGGCSCCQVSF